MKEKIGITACSDPMKPEFQSNMDRLCAILSDVGYEPVISNCIYPKIYPEAYGLHGHRIRTRCGINETIYRS